MLSFMDVCRNDSEPTLSGCLRISGFQLAVSGVLGKIKSGEHHGLLARVSRGNRHRLNPGVKRVRTDSRSMSAFSLFRFLIVKALNVYPTLGRKMWKVYYTVNPKYLASPPFRKDHMIDNHKSLFKTIWETNEWGCDESRSGHGSTLAYTLTIRESLPAVFRNFGVRTLLDAPCGDFNWMQHVKFPEGISYVGYDIVPEMIDVLERKYGSAIRKFRHGDVISEPLPTADMWLSRDFFAHLPNEIVIELLSKFKHSSISYLLTTTHHFARHNTQINMGGFRFINLRKPPFCLPKPLLEIDDFVAGYPPRVLALWSREQFEGWHPILATVAKPGGW